MKLLKLQKNLITTIHGTIRKQFVKLIGKVSLPEKEFENFSIVQIFWKICGFLDFDFQRWTFYRCNLQ